MIPPDPNPPPFPHDLSKPVPTHPPAERISGTAQTIDKRIDILRQDLESVFIELETVNDVVITVHKAMVDQNVEQDGDFANVLQRCGSNKLYEQLLELTTIIEDLGGTTSLSTEGNPGAQMNYGEQTQDE